MSYFLICFLIYFLTRVLTGYDPLENTVAISGEPPSDNPGIRTIKRAGYFLVRHFWTFLAMFAIITGMAYRVFFGGKPFGQRYWWKLCLYISGQMLLFSALCIPITFFFPQAYFLPFILEAIYILPVLGLMSGHKLGWALLKSAFALMIGHGIYALVILGVSFTVIDLLNL
ncbi:hypothetical protein AB9P05_10055 [Roseivirga sp. BDSF3-8]|uniref:hypothetical protein n=1 Tax=Roseivirga sp. BDSF3-8 TaxID=3241598 RepID=UPI003531BD9F